MTAIGLDYGTSHCSAGVTRGGRARVLPVDGERTLLPSLLWAPDLRFELDFDAAGRLRADSQRFAALAFGEAALERYLEAPDKGYYVKSPKSFLGAPGLTAQVRERFVRLVAAMLVRVRVAAETALQTPVTAAVIGRPVNFQGPAGSVENDSAVAMLEAAATMAGIPEVRFLFEPLAAAFEYEARLNAEQRVLVIDIGGGTTDCSFVRVGPALAARTERPDDVLGHSGERIGGNDYDQALALLLAVPLLGWQAERRKGLPVPNHFFIDAISINDVNAQARFYTAATAQRLEELAAEVVDTRNLERLIALQAKRGTYRLIRQFELTKIALSHADPVTCDLSFVEPGLQLQVSATDLQQASERLLEHLLSSVQEALTQGGSAPDVVYLTGGMAQSPVVRAHLKQVLGELPVLDSDHFASVTEGLSLHAARCFG